MNDVDMRLRQAERTLRDTSHAPLGQLLLEADKLAPEDLQHPRTLHLWEGQQVRDHANPEALRC